ncbi:MAG: SDR family NAD(P)-dependent oxidoreductase [Saprospirales bacterium]|nr:SDR family NAD(P)-dependent oxidoreductase [Saprospirales bacterium]
MDNTQHFLIAFHENNRAKALALKEELTPSGCSFNLLSSAETAEPGDFNRRLLSSNEHILLLVSDNMLKNEKCMYGGLEAVQQLSSSNRIIPIVIDGEYENETITTVFERVGDVIQYLNYWQDEYINLRQKRRHPDEGDDLDQINEALRIVRQVSSEIGEYLRHLRVVKHYTWEQIQASNWELFFRLVQYPAGHSLLKAHQAPEPHVEVVEMSEPPAEPIEEPIPAEEPLPAEEPQPVVELEKEIPPVIEWTELPGIAALGGPPPETPEISDQEEEPESVSNLIKKLVEHAEEQQEKEPEVQVEEPLADSVGEETPEPVEHPHSELQKVENLFEEAVSEEEDEETEVGNDILEIAEEPEEAQAILEEAQHQFDKGEVVAGLNLLSQAIEDFPQSAQIRYHYAQSLLHHAQNAPEAILELEKLVRLAPAHVPSWFMLGELAEMSHQYRQARQYYEHAVYLDPDFTEGYFRLGLLLSNHFEGEEKQAAKYFRKAFKSDKHFADAYYQYGAIQYERLGNLKKAVKALRKALKYQPAHPFANYDLALIYHGLGEGEKAFHYYQQAIANNAELQTPDNDAAFHFEPSPASDTAPPASQEKPEKQHKKEQPSDTQGIVLITGATSGIGKATATVFAREGYSLILTGRREDRLEEMQEKLKKKYSVPVRILCFDVRDAEEVTENLNELDETWRNIDILVNNAGLAKGFSPIHEGELHHWETMIDTNLKGLLYITRVVTPWMVQRKKGQVINIGSIAGKEAYPKGNVYCATKFAVDGLTKAMRMDLFQHGIRVSQICPGHVEETEFALVRFDGDAERAKIYEDFHPLNSSDVADLILYICRTPAHVSIHDVVIASAQQASAMLVDRSGRE